MSGWLESLGSAVGVDAAAALEQLKQQAEKLKEVCMWVCIWCVIYVDRPIHPIEPNMRASACMCALSCPCAVFASYLRTPY